MMPLSLLSRVELALVMAAQGLGQLGGALPAQLLRVEQGLSVLPVRVEQGLIPWLLMAHWRERGQYLNVPLNTASRRNLQTLQSELK